MVELSYIETGIDKLVSLVQSKKKISVENAAKELSLSPSQVMKLGSLLEESGLIEVKYGILGTYLVTKELSGKEIEEKTKELKKKGVLDKAQLLMQEITESKLTIQFMEKNIVGRMKKAEELIAEIKNSSGFSEVEKNLLIKELDDLARDIKILQDEMNKIGLEEKQLDSKVQDLKESLKTIELEQPSFSKMFLNPFFKLLKNIARVIKPNKVSK